MLNKPALTERPEGTVTPVEFVTTVLFPYALAQYDAFVTEHWDDAEFQRGIVRKLADGGADRASILQRVAELHAQNSKQGAFKTLQGRIWREAYTSGQVKAPLYADVVPAIERFLAQNGCSAWVYSSGSVPAQKLLFGHTNQGDVTPLFSGFFDTAVGLKQERESYANIVRLANEQSGAHSTAQEWLFLTDVLAEAEAARAAGMAAIQLVRSDNTQLVADATAYKEPWRPSMEGLFN